MSVYHCYIWFAFKQVGRAVTEHKPLNYEQKESYPIFCLAKEMNSFNDSWRLWVCPSFCNLPQLIPLSIVNLILYSIPSMLCCFNSTDVFGEAGFHFSAVAGKMKCIVQKLLLQWDEWNTPFYSPSTPLQECLLQEEHRLGALSSSVLQPLLLPQFQVEVLLRIVITSA